MGDVRKVVGGALSVALLAASLRFAWRKFFKAPVADKSEVIKLLEVTGDPKLTTVVNALLSAIEDIALTFRHTSQCKALDTQNSFGDEQLNVDVLSNHIIFKYLKDTGLVSTASSEETPEETPLGGHGFSVAFDPLDGSSIVGKTPHSELNGQNTLFFCKYPLLTICGKNSVPSKSVEWLLVIMQDATLPLGLLRECGPPTSLLA